MLRADQSMTFNPTLGALFTGLGYAAGAALFYWALRFPPRAVADPVSLTPYQRNVILVSGLLGGVLGAKLTQWLALGWPLLIPAQSILSPVGGRTILGGIVVGWLCVELAKWRLGVKRSLGAPFAIGLAGGEVLGRIGCFFNACCYGIPAAGIADPMQGLVDQFPPPGAASLSDPHPWWAIYQHYAWRWPVQLYSAAVALLLLLLLLWLRPRLRRDGDLFHVYLLAGGLSRFGLEFIRASEPVWAGLSLAQIVSLELAAAGGVALCLGWLRRNRGSARAGGGDTEAANQPSAG
ncbi:prolipoprotein diacylglyceryl transferase [bacterium]|nr:prolipoprotein diacylglyceryl transferase [bacterium]